MVITSSWLRTEANNPRLDIWAAGPRASKDNPWGVPRAGCRDPVNSEFDDFCPTPLTGGRLMFVSTRPAAPYLRIGCC